MTLASLSITDIANFAVAGATLVLSFATFLALKESRRTVAIMEAQLEAAQRPIVKARTWVRPNSTAIMLSIANDGGTPAEKLTMTLDRDYFFNGDSNEKNLRSYTAFSQEIQALASRSELEFLLGVGHRLMSSEHAPTRFAIYVQYSSGRKSYKEVLQIDLEQYRDTSGPTDVNAEGLENLAKSVRDLTAQLRRSS
ncbi:MAG: hypothetical protein ACN6OP_12845 [Pseudomonadales bacterium]